MTFEQIESILQKHNFYGLTVHKSKDGYRLIYKFHSISYYAVPIVVEVLKIDKEKIVSKVKIGTIEINDEKKVIPALNGIDKIQHQILYGKTKRKHAYNKTN